MPEYLAPGVYSERADATAPAVAALRTDIAGFVGIAPRGALDTPVPLESWRQYQAHFGSFSAVGYLAYAVRAFFENGGRRCWVVRVACRDFPGGARAATATLTSLSGKEAWTISASSAGTWGNRLSVEVKETRRAQTASDPSNHDPSSSKVATVAGFSRGSLVRLSQTPSPPLFKVVSDVDPSGSRLVWVHEREEARLPYDSPLSGFDADRPIYIESVEYSLLVHDSGRTIALYEGLSCVPEHPRYAPRLLAPWKPPSEAEARRALPAPPAPVTVEDLLADPLDPLDLSGAAPVPLAEGADGMAQLSVGDFIGEPPDPLDTDEEKTLKARGLRCLEGVDEIAIVAVPDIHIQPIPIPAVAPPEPCVPDPCLPLTFHPAAEPRGTAGFEQPPVFSEEEIARVQAILVEQCEDRRDRIAILDPPLAAAREDAGGIAAARAWRSRFDSRYAAFYYPWVRVVDPLRGMGAGASFPPTRAIPPSGHVAGQYAATDFAVGVHKAPANTPLAWVEDTTAAVGEAAHGVLNPLGINALRVLPGRGIRIYGARTVSSDPSWRYVNVRRLLMMIEEAIDISTQWAAFEPNNHLTRAKIRLSLASFLISLWQKGALAGKTREEAFFVRCDESNNPSDQREQGRLLAEVGVAPSNPFEFVVLRIGRTGNEFEITESAAEGTAA